ncbi:MAG: hypothetical protein ACR2LK_11575 [Solirubrobacteraceae bacterium]
MRHDDPIHITIPASADDPRGLDEIEGVIIHRVPELHPDDVTVLDGIPVTTVARTLVDLAEDMTRAELRATFARAAQLGLLDLDAVRASAARVEWRPSLAMLHDVIEAHERAA